MTRLPFAAAVFLLACLGSGLAAIDLAVELEQETGLRFEEQDLRRIRFVRDIVDLVCNRLVVA